MSPLVLDSISSAILLPDLVSHCTFKLRLDRNHRLVSSESKRWLLNSNPNLDQAARRAFFGLKAGKLAAMCYPHCGYPQLRVCSDFLYWLFHLDNLSDDMDDRSVDEVANVVMNSLRYPYTYQSTARLSRMTRDFYRRFVDTASPGTRRRFESTMARFFRAVRRQALDRANGTIPDLESYIALRRDTSGCLPSWALIEFAYHLRIPDDVIDHPVLQTLGEAANDLVTWSNDIFSYNKEQSQGHAHNMIDVLTHAQPELSLQAAFNIVGDLCKSAIDRFMHARTQLPSWNPTVDADVRVYVDGLADWIVGSLNWSFETERYFGIERKTVRETRRVVLKPKRVRASVTGLSSPARQG